MLFIKAQANVSGCFKKIFWYVRNCAGDETDTANLCSHIIEKHQKSTGKVCMCFKMLYHILK